MDKPAAMPDDGEFEAMTEACIEAGERVMRAGSPTLKTAMRALLSVLGQEIARRAHGANGADCGAGPG